MEGCKGYRVGFFDISGKGVVVFVWLGRFDLNFRGIIIGFGID